MVFEHDYKRFPELSKSQLAEFGFTSPHKQITEDFSAEVVRVHDGDTVTVSVDFRDFDFPIRFLDIDARELNEGGEDAKDFVKRRIEGRVVEIKINPDNRVDKFGRLLGYIIAGGLNVGEELLMRGLAVPFAKKDEGKLPDLNKELSVKRWL